MYNMKDIEKIADELVNWIKTTVKDATAKGVVWYKWRNRLSSSCCCL